MYPEVCIPIRSSHRILLMASLSAGCAHTYQAIGGLHAPAVVDPTAPNLAGQSVHVQCTPGEGQRTAHTVLLCRHVSTLFANQGARVTLTDPTTTPAASDLTGGHRPDLSVTLVPSVAPQRSNAVGWLACVASAGLLTATTQSIFAIDTTVQDGDGFLLAQSRLEGRVVSRFGWGAWLDAVMTNQSWRPNSPQISHRAVSEQLSDDVYGQLSQLASNAASQRVIRPERIATQERP